MVPLELRITSDFLSLTVSVDREKGFSDKPVVITCDILDPETGAFLDRRSVMIEARRHKVAIRR